MDRQRLASLRNNPAPNSLLTNFVLDGVASRPIRSAPGQPEPPSVQRPQGSSINVPSSSRAQRLSSIFGLAEGADARPAGVASPVRTDGLDNDLFQSFGDDGAASELHHPLIHPTVGRPRPSPLQGAISRGGLPISPPREASEGTELPGSSSDEEREEARLRLELRAIQIQQRLDAIQQSKVRGIAAVQPPQQTRVPAAASSNPSGSSASAVPATHASAVPTSSFDSTTASSGVVSNSLGVVSNSSVPSASTPPNSPHPSIATASGPSIPPVTASFPLPVDASAPLYATILHQYTLEGKRQQEAYNDCPTFVLQDAPKLTMQNEELVARAIHVFLGTKKSPLQQYWTSCQLAGTFPMMLQSILQKDRPTWNALMRVFPATAKLLTSSLQSDSDVLFRMLQAAARNSQHYNLVPTTRRKERYQISNPSGTLADYGRGLLMQKHDLADWFEELELASPGCLKFECLLDQWISSQVSSQTKFYATIRDANDIRKDSRGPEPVLRMLDILSELFHIDKSRPPVVLRSSSVMPMASSDGSGPDPRYSYLSLDALVAVQLTPSGNLSSSQVDPSKSSGARAAAISASPTTCSFCKKPNHTEAVCRTKLAQAKAAVASASSAGPPAAVASTSSSVPAKGRPVCNYCKHVGHTEDRCHKKQRKAQQAARTAATQATPSSVSDSAPPTTGATASGTATRRETVQAFIEGRKSSSTLAPDIVCWHCHTAGHSRANCPTLHPSSSAPANSTGARTARIGATTDVCLLSQSLTPTAASTKSVALEHTAMQQRRFLVPAMATHPSSPHIQQRPVTLFLDNGSDITIGCVRDLAPLFHMTAAEFTAMLDPPSPAVQAVQGHTDAAGKDKVLGTLNLALEVIYRRSDLALRGLTEVIEGDQTITLHIIGGNNSYAQFAPESKSPVILVGSDSLVGAPTLVINQLQLELLQPHIWQLDFQRHPLSEVYQAGFRLDPTPLGAANEVSSPPKLTSVPGDTGDSRLGRLLDADLEVRRIAAAQAGGLPAPLWSEADIQAQVSKSCHLSPAAQAEVVRIIYEEQPAQPFPSREGDEASRLPVLSLPKELRAFKPDRSGINCRVSPSNWPVVQKIMDLGVCHYLDGTPAENPNVWILRPQFIEESPTKTRFVLDPMQVNKALQQLNPGATTRMISTAATLEKLASAAFLDVGDMKKAYFQLRLANGDQQYFGFLDPTGRIVVMDAVVMGLSRAAGTLSSGLQSATLEFNSWSAIAPDCFPPGSKVLRMGLWFADNGYLALFVVLPSGEKILLDKSDPRRAQLEPLHAVAPAEVAPHGAAVRALRGWRHGALNHVVHQSRYTQGGKEED